MGDLVHLDIFEPLEPSYPNRHCYFSTFHSDHSWCNFSGMMQHKSDLGALFTKFTCRFSGMMSKPTGVLTFPKEHERTFDKVASCIKKLHLDDGKEYIRLTNVQLPKAF